MTSVISSTEVEARMNGEWLHEEPTERVPLKMDKDGAIRVAGKRLTLDTVIVAYQLGATAEEIVQQYSPVRLADVYTIIGYYLNHQAEIDAYVAERERTGEELRREIEANSDLPGIRARLMARESRH